MTNHKKNNKKSVRLDPHIYPTNYNLEIHPDLLSFIFKGHEVIKIKNEKEINKITVHSKDLDISTVKYKTEKSEQFAIKITYDEEKETTTFFFKEKIKKGIGELSISWIGIISDSLRGFYRSRYEVDGETKHIATTQFEATDARRAFPCFDEPAHKAVFEVSLITEEGHEAISNTLPIEVREHSAGYKITKFAPSPKMSTYLLAFIVGEFEYIEGKTKDNVLIRVFTTRGKKHQARFALDIAIKSTEFFNDYFDIPYPMPNLDLITIQDFEPAGMENWGAITFRESSLLIDEENSSLTNKQWVATTIAHEIAHQWFGNLVTMHWWTDLWLNEGFASYMEKVCTDHLFPYWNVWDLYLSNGRYRNAIEIDALKTSHPIEVELYHPNEINETFDMVSYEKGTAMIRMLAYYIGEKSFRKGLTIYLKKHSYKNTKTNDLWDSFEKASKKPVRKVMNSWTSQMGFPIISAQSNGNTVKLEQEKFFSSRKTRKNNKAKYLWQIPLSYKSTGKEKNILLDKKSVKIKDSLISKINHNEISFLKVKYDEKLLSNLKKEIEDGRLSKIDKLGFIRDIFALVEGGYIKTSEALEISLSFVNEKDYIIWDEISFGINKIYNILDNKNSIILYKKYMNKLYGEIIKNINFDKKADEKSEDTLLRSLIISITAFAENKDVINKAKQIFEDRKIESIDPDIKSVIYAIIASNGGPKEWQEFRKMYKEDKLEEEKERIAKAMASFKDEKLVKKTLEFAISKEVRDNFAPYLIAAVWRNKTNQKVVWGFMKENWSLILKRYGENGLLLSKLLYLLGNHTKIEDLKDAKKFFSKQIAPGAERTLLQAYERIESNAAWLKDDKKDIESWLNKKYN